MRSRQTGALLICLLTVPSVLLLPKLHPAAVVTVAVLCMVLWHFSQDELPEVLRPCGRTVLRLFLTVLCLTALARASFFTGSSYPTASHRLWLELLLLALAIYAASGGIDRILRTGAISFFFLLVIYGIIAVFSLKNINIVYPTGLLRPHWGYTALAWLFLPLAFRLQFGVELTKKKGRWTLGLLFAAVLPNLLVWISQSPVFAEMEGFPFYAMVKTIRAFNVMERFEPILSAALTAGNFLLMSTLSCFCLQNVRAVVPTASAAPVQLGSLLVIAALRLCGTSCLDAAIAICAPILWGIVPICLSVKKSRKN